MPKIGIVGGGVAGLYCAWKLLKDHSVTVYVRSHKKVLGVSISVFLFSLLFAAPAVSQQTSALRTYLGFDRNEYPGDAALLALRKSFSFTGYWLGPPPGAKSNSWSGKRELLRSLGFGFLVLYSGPQSSELQQKWSEEHVFNSLKSRMSAAMKRGATGAPSRSNGKKGRLSFAHRNFSGYRRGRSLTCRVSHLPSRLGRSVGAR